MTLAVVYSREFDGQALTLSASGYTYYYTFILFDFETESMWLPTNAGPQFESDTCGCTLVGITGQYAGRLRLPLTSTPILPWHEWYTNHPDSWVLKNPGLWPKD